MGVFVTLSYLPSEVNLVNSQPNSTPPRPQLGQTEPGAQGLRWQQRVERTVLTYLNLDLAKTGGSNSNLNHRCSYC